MNIDDLEKQLFAKKRSIADLARFISNRTDNNPNYTLLLGAGCSISSGIRSAGELIIDWRNDLCPADIRGAEAQKRYLKAFPQDYRGFMALFGVGGSLADGYQCDYIFALSALQVHHSNQVGRLLVQLSKDAEYQADAPSCLQHVLANYGSRYTKAFAGFLHELAPKERDQLITFLADIDTKVTSNLDYRRIIRNLKQLNEPELAKKFQQAEIDRARQPHG